uniref:ARAD1D13882p n=1 Tax=Blastobotrys adeninivorans TaxID=409370 RepID=A0A060T9A1_BLAAD
MCVNCVLIAIISSSLQSSLIMLPSYQDLADYPLDQVVSPTPEDGGLFNYAYKDSSSEPSSASTLVPDSVQTKTVTDSTQVIRELSSDSASDSTLIDELPNNPSDTPLLSPKDSTKSSNARQDQMPDLISNLPNQRSNIVAKRGAEFTLMVAGESGLGKTTFINTLFCDKFISSSDDRRLLQRTRMGPENGAPVERYDKTTHITIHGCVYEENDFSIKFTVIDTPGFGDYTNNTNSWAPIVNYIDEQHRMYMLREEQPDRSQICDTRVHVCLYFIRPSGHGLLPLDIKVMQELSCRVNLIPIIAKSDSFSMEDREKFKAAILRDIVQHGIQTYTPPATTPQQELDNSTMPFAIFSSDTTCTNSNGKRVRGRQYRWGLAEVENENHCDFSKLRRVIMTEHMLDLIDTTAEMHYERYRTKTMLDRIAHAKAVNSESAKLVSEHGGLSALMAIWTYGSEFLQEKVIEDDPIYADKKRKQTERFEFVVTSQERKFENWRNELRAQQNAYNEELEQLHSEVFQLQEEVNALELRTSSPSSRQYGNASLHQSTESTEAKSLRSARYALRK